LDPLAGRSDLVYQHLVWSPDAAHLAVTFTTAEHAGLLLLREDGSFLSRLVLPPLPVATTLVQWDLRLLTVQSLTLPHAPAYRWQATGLVPVPPPAAASGAISPWQPGLLLVSRQPTAQWTTYPFNAWSPDGRFLVTTLVLSATLIKATPATDLRID